MKETFVSEGLEPVAGTFDTRRMAMGEPGLPAEFVWRGERVRIVRVHRTWKETGPCRGGSGEQYVRKHWYDVEDAAGRRLKIYFVRSAQGKKLPPSRWTVFSQLQYLVLILSLTMAPWVCHGTDTSGQFVDDLIADERAQAIAQVSNILRSTNSSSWKIQALTPFVKVGDTKKRVEAMFGPFRGWGHGIGVYHGTYRNSGLFLSFMPEKPFSSAMRVYEIGYSLIITNGGFQPNVWLIRNNPAFYPDRTNVSYSVMF